ncbi:hypothetical protein HanRHA438_Chr09g0385131 [Helianthus annuus]|nr:hypothetical protein HanRHA438_Chr09g0385131 [Helianthus annuus]
MFGLVAQPETETCGQVFNQGIRLVNNVLKTGKYRPVIPVLPFPDENPVRNTPVNK